MSDEQTMGSSGVSQAMPSGNASGFVASTQPISESKPETSSGVPQEYVNKLVGTAKEKGYEKGYETARQEWEQKYASQQTQAPATQTQNPMGFDESKAEAWFNERMQKLEAHRAQQAIEEKQRAEGQRIAMELSNKINAAKQKYADFDQVTANLDVTQIPHELVLINEFDNAGEMLYEIGKDQSKLAKLFVRGITPEGQRAALKAFSDSIKMNQQAPQMRTAPEPLDHLTPSNVGTGSNPAGELERLKRQYTV